MFCLCVCVCVCVNVFGFCVLHTTVICIMIYTSSNTTNMMSLRIFFELNGEEVKVMGTGPDV